MYVNRPGAYQRAARLMARAGTGNGPGEDALPRPTPSPLRPSKSMRGYCDLRSSVVNTQTNTCGTVSISGGAIAAHAAHATARIASTSPRLSRTEMYQSFPSTGDEGRAALLAW